MARLPGGPCYFLDSFLNKHVHRRQLTIDILSRIALSFAMLCAWLYFRLSAFSFTPDTYLIPPDRLPLHTRYALLLASHPAIQVLIGLYCLAIAVAYFRNSRLYWPLVALLCLVQWPLAPFDASIFYSLASATTLAAVVYCWGQRPQNYSPQSRPSAASPAFLIAAIAILLPIGLMAYVFVYQPRKAAAQTDFSALYGYRMVNRRGAWHVDSLIANGQARPGFIDEISFLTSDRCECRGESGLQSGSYFSYTQSIHLTCLPKSISPSGAEVQAIWQGPRLILRNNHLQITLSRDKWGPGYYRDLVPAFFTK